MKGNQLSRHVLSVFVLDGDVLCESWGRGEGCKVLTTTSLIGVSSSISDGFSVFLWFGVSSSGKTDDFDSSIQRFESFHPSIFIRLKKGGEKTGS